MSEEKEMYEIPDPAQVGLELFAPEVAELAADIENLDFIMKTRMRFLEWDVEKMQADPAWVAALDLKLRKAQVLAELERGSR